MNCILQRKFFPDNNDYNDYSINTRSINYCNNTYLLEFYDSIGIYYQETIKDFYINKSNGCILFYSISHLSSFNEIINLYNNIIQYYSSKFPIILVGYIESENNRKISYIQGKEFADKCNISFYECKNNSYIFDNIILELVQDMINYNNIHTKINTKQKELYTAITNDNDKYISNYLLKNYNINLLKELFCFSCMKGNLYMIKYFIKQYSIDINSPDKCGKTPIQYCAEEGYSNIISFLLDNNALPICKGGKHLLQWCFENNKYNILPILLTRNDFDSISTSHIKQKLISEAQKLSPIRVTILGAPASGKTTLTRLIEIKLNKKSGFPTENLATDGIAISKMGKYAFWDFGGQELLYSTHQFFLSEETQYILVVDLSLLIHSDENKRKQCEKDTCYWIELIKHWTISHTSPPVLIVGTHCDLLIKSKLRGEKKDIDKACNKLLSLINKYNLRTTNEIYKVSKTSKSQKSIKELYIKITELTNEYISKNRGLIKGSENNLNLLHTALRLIIENKRKRNQFIWWNEYILLCNSIGITDENEISKVTKFLVNFGCILTYRHQSTSASLVILDPEWLIKAFTSIISIKFHSSKLKRGFFTRDILEKHWKDLDINESTWPQLERLFELFQLLVKLPNNEYFVPIMLHSLNSSKILSNEERLTYINNKIPQNSLFYGRKIVFEKLPFGLVDRLVVRLLHYPNLILDTHISILNDYFIYSNIYYIRILSNYDKNEILLYLYTLEKHMDLSFFAHFLFESPQSLLDSYISLNTRILSSIVIHNSNEIGEERDIINNILKGKYLGNESPDLGLEDIPRLDVSDSKIIKRLATGTFGIAWLGTLNNKPVVFKELRNTNFKQQKEFLKEVLMMKLLDYKYLVKLIGICNISKSLFKSSKLISFDNPMKSKGLLIVLEFASYSDLSNCRLQLKDKSTLLKIKIALDIVIGLRDLHNSVGLPMIHRDVRSQNIFIYSLDEELAKNKDSIHAKLADFGTVVIASPNYGETLGNWQYMAPEAFQGALTVPYTSKIDVYSFGIVLWEIFTNEIPFKEYIEPGKAEEGKDNILKGERPNLSNIKIPTLSLLINKCWDTDPNERPQFEDIVKQLENIYNCYLNYNNNKILPNQLINTNYNNIGNNFNTKQIFINNQCYTIICIEDTENNDSCESDNNIIYNPINFKGLNIIEDINNYQFKNHILHNTNINILTIEKGNNNYIQNNIIFPSDLKFINEYNSINYYNFNVILYNDIFLVIMESLFNTNISEEYIIKEEQQEDNIIIKEETDINIWEQNMDNTEIFNSNYTILTNLNGLVISVTNPNKIDSSLINSFASTYKCYTTSDKLFTKIKERFNVPNQIERYTQNRIIIRVLTFLKIWISVLTTKDKDILLKIQDYLQNTFTIKEYNELCSTTLHLISKKLLNEEIISNIKGISYHNIDLEFINLNMLQVAQELTLIDFELFSKIKVNNIFQYHCIYNDWNKSYLSNDIKDILNFSNLISNFISTIIITTSNSKSRVLVYEKCILLAKYLYDINNFNLLFAVLCGLNNYSIYRLKETKKNITKELLDELVYLEDKLSINQSFNNYRIISKSKFPLIPIINILLQDLTYIDEYYPSYINNYIHYSKYIIKYRKGYTIIMCKTSNYNFKSIPTIRNYIKTLKIIPNNELLKISKQIE